MGQYEVCINRRHPVCRENVNGLTEFVSILFYAICRVLLLYSVGKQNIINSIEMVRSSGGVAKIPSLGDVDTSGNAASASLRGNYHNKVPEISGALNTLMPVLKDGSLHPEPYYITQNVV